jgi:caa(3)-type oxidase subunit IV
MSEHVAHAAHDDSHYWKVWAILCALLVVSVVGPMLEIRAVTLITAFGIAIVKAYMVAKNFMHLDVERRYVVYLLLTMLVFMFLFFAAAAPDVMKWEGDNWVKPFVAQESSSAAHH